MDIDFFERKTYWEIEDTLNCPVVGTCLTLKEQKKLLKKSSRSVVGCTDHQIHHALVQSGQSENGLSRRIQRALEGKYKQEIAELGFCDEETFMKHWKQGLRRGEIAALLWVGVTNPNLPAAAAGRIFADYHMHMHGQGFIIRNQLQQMDTLKKKNERLSTQLKQARAEKQQTTQSLQAVERERNNLQQKVQSLQKKNTTLQNHPLRNELQQANGALEDQVLLLENRLRAQEEALVELKEENGRLAISAAEQAKINQVLRTEFDWLTRQNEAEQPACATCTQRDICPCRVLIVGGLDTLRPHYQHLVESGGGEFKHFDGRSGNSERALRPMIGWADVILCPVDHNSHRACLSVKKLCKKMQKPYQMLSSSSMSHMSRVLADLAADLP